MSEWTFPAGALMAGKRGLVMGVANDKSIAWGIASQLAAQGAVLLLKVLELVEDRFGELVAIHGAFSIRVGFWGGCSAGVVPRGGAGRAGDRG